MKNRTIGMIVLLMGVLLLGGASLVMAQGGGETPTPTGDDGACLLCHLNPDAPLTLPNGETLNIEVHPDTLTLSVHGEGNPEGALGCVDCHGEAFPHEGADPASLRAWRITAAEACATCHEDQVSHLADGVHYTALALGNLRAATCVDCHGSHDIQPPAEPRGRISQTCGNCHTTVFSEYESSIHGQALFEENDPNVPTCVDCHGVHGISHPTTALFRNRSPELCAGCHSDAELMDQYDLTTNVFTSYLTDFHGETVAIFEQIAPDVATNKAVCYDCHGVHDITDTHADNSHVIRENLLETCQQCHPDATADFPDAWIGHFAPTFETHPVLFVVNAFYSVVIPLTLGGFVLLIVTDIIRRVRTRGQKADHGQDTDGDNQSADDGQPEQEGA